MINSLGGIGAYQGLFATRELPQSTNVGVTFDDAYQQSAQLNQTENDGPCLSLGGGSGVQQYDEMDLNQDGQVTIDEVIKYMQLQQSAQDFSQEASEEGASQMQSQDQTVMSMEDYKTKQATKAYQFEQNLLNDVSNILLNSFLA